MQTITLKVEDHIKARFFQLLNHFSRNDIEILETTEYTSDDEYLRSIKGMEQSIMQAAKEPIKHYKNR